MNALEPAERTHWRARGIGKLQVKLHHLIASGFSGVRDSDGSIKRVSAVEWRIREGEIGIPERCIAQPVSEWPQRFAFEVAVGAAFHRVVFEMGQLMDIFIKCDGKAPGRIILSVQSLSDCPSTLLAGIPGFKNGIGVRLLPVYAERTTV